MSEQVIKLSACHEYTGVWEPEMYSPLHIKRMSLRLRIPVKELVAEMGLEEQLGHVDFKRLQGYFQSDKKPVKYHWSAAPNCSVVNSPDRHPEASKRIIDGLKFDNTPHEERCQYCEHQFRNS